MNDSLVSSPLTRQFPRKDDTGDPASVEARPAAREPLTDPISTWQPLRVLNLYRILVAGLLTILSYQDLLESFFGIPNSTAFLNLASIYFAFALVNTLTIAWRTPEFKQQLFAQVIIDISLISALIHVSNGVESSLGVLLVVSIAGHSLLLRPRVAGLFIAIASVTLLLDQTWLVLVHAAPGQTLTQAGLLGATLFVTGFLAIHLARRARAESQLAASKGLELANMARINERVIQHLESGVLVVDAGGIIIATNQQARRLLGLPHDCRGTRLTDQTPQLADTLSDWRANPTKPTQGFHIPGSSDEILPRFQGLTGDSPDSSSASSPDNPPDSSGHKPSDNPAAIATNDPATRSHADEACLILLQDSATLCNQAQESRLTALGRLTAGIAHEIRNPLSAIRQAGQLLAEETQNNPQQQRLTEIIDANTLRVNSTIESILQLSRRSQTLPAEFALSPWLETFAEEFRHDHVNDNIELQLELSPEVERFVFNQGQLRQILDNLCKNSIRHGQPDGPAAGAKTPITIRSGLDSYNRYIEVADNGPGVSPEALPHLFEPFYSTHSSGTGLGLYIAFELCNSNRAHLEYRDPKPELPTGSCFRINIGH